MWRAVAAMEAAINSRYCRNLAPPFRLGSPKPFGKPGASGIGSPKIMNTLPADARPREKLLARGPASLSDPELLALLLRTGTPGRGVLQMAQEVLDCFGGIAGLLHTTADDLRRINGLRGPAKRAQLVAVLELARRALSQQLREREVFSSPGAVRHYLQLHLS